MGTLGGDDSFIGDINNSGQLIGTSELTPGDNSDYDAFIWSAATGIQDLGTLGTASQGFGINDTGQVDGVFHSSSGHLHTHVRLDGGERHE